MNTSSMIALEKADSFLNCSTESLLNNRTWLSPILYIGHRLLVCLFIAYIIRRPDALTHVIEPANSHAAAAAAADDKSPAMQRPLPVRPTFVSRMNRVSGYAT